MYIYTHTYTYVYTYSLPQESAPEASWWRVTALNPPLQAVWYHQHRIKCYGVATMSRMLKNIGLFAEYRSLL